MLGLSLLLAIGMAGSCWYWNRRVNTPNPYLAIVVQTDFEAVEGAKRFLVSRHVNTDQYDLSQASHISKEMFKGQNVWRIVWSPKQDLVASHDMIVVITDTGYCFTFEPSSNNNYTETVIQGRVTKIAQETHR